MSRTTFFRFNRITLLVGLMVCALLPLIELTATEETFLHTPLYGIHELLQGMEPVLSRLEQVGDDNILVAGGKNETLPVVLTLAYGAGALATLIWLVLSTCRLIQLIRMSEKKRCKGYVLVISSQPIASFCWGQYIVISASDYSLQPEEILLHEQMHLRNHHTLDLLFMQVFLIFHWFNPIVWLLKRELQEIHEFEADNGVINTGIDVTKYQLLLVKKAVGTRLYSMVNGFHHSKLKKRITMMLKERTNRWARLKLLLAVPVMAGALYAFAQPEVKETPRLLQTGAGQDEVDDYVSLMLFFKKEGAAYSSRQEVYGDNPSVRIKEPQAHPLLVNARNKVLFDGNLISVDEVKPAIVKNLLHSWEKSGRTEVQSIFFQYDRGAETTSVAAILKEVKAAFEQIRADLSVSLADKSKASLDRLFPILLVEGDPKKYGLQELSAEERIPQITVTLHTPAGEDVLENFTLAELKQKVIAAREQMADPAAFTVSLKVKKDCRMGFVTDVKQVLRESYAFKVNVDNQ